MGEENEGGRPDRARGGALESYLRAIRRIRLLTGGEPGPAPDGEVRGPAWRRKLVESNLRIVVKIAREYASFGAPMEDLVNQGNIGLIEAAQRFDPARGVPFGSYAAWWIRKEILSELERNRAQTSAPGPESRAAGPRAQGAPRPRPARQRLISLEEFAGEGDSRGILEKLAATPGDDPEEMVLQRELADAIRSVLPLLPDVERGILIAHFGLDGEPPLTLHEIGGALGYSRERVRQIQVRTLARVRRLLLSRRVDPRR